MVEIEYTQNIEQTQKVDSRSLKKQFSTKANTTIENIN